MSYITARHVMNRLDEVVGITNWYDAYEHTPSGLQCKLTVIIDGEMVTKVDGGAAADMAEGDNNEKSAYSDAFKRAAVKFGIGRHLYGDGIPGAPTAAASRPAESGSSYQNRQAPAQQRTSGGINNFQIPPTGKAVFAWCKNMESHYGLKLVDGMAKAGTSVGKGSSFAAWDQGTVNEICGRVIAMLKTRPNYQGEFDSMPEPAQEQPESDDDIPF